MFLGVERDHHVAALPHAFHLRVASEAHAVTQVPDADQLFQVAAGGRHARGNGIGIVQDQHGGVQPAAAEYAAQSRREGEALDLLQVGGLLDDAAANDTWETHPHAVDLSAIR